MHEIWYCIEMLIALMNCYDTLKNDMNNEKRLNQILETRKDLPKRKLTNATKTDSNIYKISPQMETKSPQK